jgi:hypothetical protein
MAETKKPPVRRTTQALAAPVATRRPGSANTGGVESDELMQTLKLGSSSTPSVPPASRAVNAERPAADRSGIELIVIQEENVPHSERRAWRAAEVWTKRTVYGLDSTFRCIEVLDRETGRCESSHELLGARLGGGRSRDEKTANFSYPLPLVGMEAMFSKGKKHGYTSPVERLVVRVRVLRTAADDAPPSWEAIASRWTEPPPKS